MRGPVCRTPQRRSSPPPASFLSVHSGRFSSSTPLESKGFYMFVMHLSSDEARASFPKAVKPSLPPHPVGINITEGCCSAQIIQSARIASTGSRSTLGRSPDGYLRPKTDRHGLRPAECRIFPMKDVHKSNEGSSRQVQAIGFVSIEVFRPVLHLCHPLVI